MAYRATLAEAAAVMRSIWRAGMTQMERDREDWADGLPIGGAT